MIGGSGEKKTLRLVAQYADACNIAPSPEVAHKRDVLRTHCDTVGRDYDEIEKTTILVIDPTHTVEDIVTLATSMAGLGFTAVYVAARDITDPDRIIATLSEAAARLG